MNIFYLIIDNIIQYIPLRENNVILYNIVYKHKGDVLMFSRTENNIVVRSEEKLFNYKKKPLHYNDLPNNRLVTYVIDKFDDENYYSIINSLKILYWTHCETEDYFNNCLKIIIKIKNNNLEFTLVDCIKLIPSIRQIRINKVLA